MFRPQYCIYYHAVGYDGVWLVKEGYTHPGPRPGDYSLKPGQTTTDSETWVPA